MPTTKRRTRKPKIDFLKASQNRETFRGMAPPLSAASGSGRKLPTSP